MAHDNDQIIGMVVISIPDKPQTVLKMHNPTKNGKIELLYADEAYRKQGIGKRLLAYGEARLKEKGCNYVSLEVMPVNDAYMMYKHLGFADRSVSMLKEVS